jgi:hypothetical protein
MPEVSATFLKQMPALFSGRHFSSFPVLPVKGGRGVSFNLPSMLLDR